MLDLFGKELFWWVITTALTALRIIANERWYCTLCWPIHPRLPQGLLRQTIVDNQQLICAFLFSFFYKCFITGASLPFRAVRGAHLI